MPLVIFLYSTNNVPIISCTKMFRESINYFRIFTL